MYIHPHYDTSSLHPSSRRCEPLRILSKQNPITTSHLLPRSSPHARERSHLHTPCRPPCTPVSEPFMKGIKRKLYPYGGWMVRHPWTRRESVTSSTATPLWLSQMRNTHSHHRHSSRGEVFSEAYYTHTHKQMHRRHVMSSSRTFRRTRAIAAFLSEVFLCVGCVTATLDADSDRRNMSEKSEDLKRSIGHFLL